MNFDLVLKFLSPLAKNNNREWFEKNKSRYLEAKGEFEGIVGNVLDELIKFDDSLTGLDPKKLVFRIYRDVRFSKDKRPYKTNLGASFSPTGKGMGKPGYYFQLEPGNKSFMAAGLFMPEPANLAKVRQEIDYNGNALMKIFKDRNFKKNFKKFWDDEKLKTAPKGYPKDHPHIEWLKLKSFIVIHEFTDAEIRKRGFFKNLIGVLRSAKPLNDFLHEALE